jgi:hypothetical protein
VKFKPVEILHSLNEELHLSHIQNKMIVAQLDKSTAHNLMYEGYKTLNADSLSPLLAIALSHSPALILKTIFFSYG